MADTTAQGVTVNSRRYGVYKWGLVVSLLLILFVVVVLAVALTLNDENTTILLTILVLTLVIVGIAACLFMQWLHRRAMRRRDEGAKEWIHHTLSVNQLHVAADPTPPPEPTAPSLTPRSSWNWAPWRKSTPSTGPPSYRAVSRSSGSS
ncbi:hypothetical protein C0J52_08580 [Blattella germanica]|nr:hypothetical protein C0J52_08580 [Blattella germanica]